MAEVPMRRGRTAWREGPLLSSSVPSKERQPDCPARGSSTPPRRAKAKRPARLELPANCRGAIYRAAKQQPQRRFTLLYGKVCRRTFCKRPGNGKVQQRAGSGSGGDQGHRRLRRRSVSEPNSNRNWRSRQTGRHGCAGLHTEARTAGEDSAVGHPTVKDEWCRWR